MVEKCWIGHLFLQLAVLDNVVKKLSTGHILHHHKDIGWRGNHLKDEMSEKSHIQKGFVWKWFPGFQLKEESSTW